MLIVLAVGLCLSFNLIAHQSPQKRALTVQFEKDSISMLLFYSLPDTKNTQSLMLRYDSNHDGKIDPVEGNKLGKVLLPAALQHLTFEVIGESPGAKEPSLKFNYTKEGALEMMVLMEFELKPLKKDHTRKLKITMADDHHAIETAVQLQSMSPLMLSTQEPPTPGSFENQSPILKLTHHNQITTTLVHASK